MGCESPWRRYRACRGCRSALLYVLVSFAIKPADPESVPSAGDDVAIPRSQEAITGRRGLAATVLVYKVAGALAATGASIDEVEHLARIVAERSGTISVGFKHSEDLGDDEAEIGVGEYFLHFVRAGRMELTLHRVLQAA